MLDLLDYRRRVGDIYRMIRDWGTDSPQSFAHFCRERDSLYGTHPQSPLDEGQKYAYHPSCHYNPRWVCPLAPSQNRLDFAIPVGEMASQIPVMGATEF